jgi:hypothetical protein
VREARTGARRRWKYDAAETPSARLVAANDMLRAALARSSDPDRDTDSAAASIVEVAERIDSGGSQ